MQKTDQLEFSDIIKTTRWQSLFGLCDRDLFKKFTEYHARNAELYELFKKFAFDAKRIGKRKRFSIWMIANRIRWYTQVETSGREFKVSNDYLALYARLLIYEYPEFYGFFQLKTMKAQRVKARE